MHRFYIPGVEPRGGNFLFEGDEWRHCQKVLRLKKGDRITLFDGKGNEYPALIEEAKPKEARLRILGRHATPRPALSVTLVQAIPKGKSMDLIIQKATELGVQAIQPIFSERTVVQVPKEEMEGKLERWRQISAEAAKQCGLNWLPEISSIKTVKEAVERGNQHPLALIASLQPDSKPLRAYLSPEASIKKAVLMIGPEGDFTPAEYNMARSTGFLPLSLGKLVLRCETAVIYALSILNYELGT